MPIQEDRITRYTVTCDSCGTSVTFEGSDNWPTGWRTRYDPLPGSWGDTTAYQYCSLKCVRDHFIPIAEKEPVHADQEGR